MKRKLLANSLVVMMIITMMFSGMIVASAETVNPEFGPELVKNGTFDADLTDWEDGSGAGTDLAVESVDPISGKYVIITATGWGSGANQKIQNITAGTYRLTFDYKGKSMIWFGPNDWNKAPDIVDNPYEDSIDAWKTRSFDFVVSFDTAYYTLRLISNMQGPTLYDNVSIRKITNADPIPTGDVKNGDFEANSFGGYYGWQKSSQSNNTPTVVKAADEGIVAVDGINVAKIDALNGAAIMTQLIAVKLGQKYKLTYYKKGPLSGYQTVNPGCINEWGNEQNGHVPAHGYHSLNPVTEESAPDENGWIKVTKEFTTIGNSIKLTFRTDNWTATPGVPSYIDALSLVEVNPATPEPTEGPTQGATEEPTQAPTQAPTASPTPEPTPAPTVDTSANVLAPVFGDVSFETGTVGEAVPSWGAPTVLSDAKKNAGSKSLLLPANAYTQRFSNQSLLPNTKYRMSCYMQAPGPGVNVMFRLTYRAFGADVEEATNYFTAGSNWVKVVKEFTTPYKVDQYGDGINYYSIAYWSATDVYIDDLALEVVETYEAAPINVSAVAVSNAQEGTYTDSLDLNLGNDVYFKVTTASKVDKLDMYFVELGYGQTYLRNDPAVTCTGNDWVIRKPINYAMGMNSVKFRTNANGLKSVYSTPVTVNVARFQPITGVFVGTEADPAGVSASVLRGQDLYFKVTTSAPVTKLNMYFEELNYGETYEVDDPTVVSVSDTEWIIKRPITYYKGSINIGFKAHYNGKKSDLSSTLAVTTTN